MTEAPDAESPIPVYAAESASVMHMDDEGMHMDDSHTVISATPNIPAPPDSPDIKDITRRVGVTEAINTDLVVIKRKKKISIQIPDFPSSAHRLYRVYLSSKKYKHLLDEARGGVYGPSSRPELEIQEFEFECVLPSDDSTKASTSTVSKTLLIELIYDPEKHLYVISRRVEDKLLLYLHQHRDRHILHSDGLKSAICRIATFEMSMLDLFRQRMFRRFLTLYIAPLLEDPLRVNYAIAFVRALIVSGEDEVLTPEVSDDGGWEFSDSSSDSESEKKKVVRRKKASAMGKGATKKKGYAPKHPLKKQGTGSKLKKTGGGQKHK